MENPFNQSDEGKTAKLTSSIAAIMVMAGATNYFDFFTPSVKPSSNRRDSDIDVEAKVVSDPLLLDSAESEDVLKEMAEYIGSLRTEQQVAIFNDNLKVYADIGMSDIASISVLRYSYRLKGQCSNWNWFYSHVENQLTQHGKDAKALLRGLDK